MGFYVVDKRVKSKRGLRNEQESGGVTGVVFIDEALTDDPQPRRSSAQTP
jgi:hypothetical protein